jgi:HAE1 family hydrophobic/amphiphilic exporter-1
MMTSFAFILGLLPLVIATGPGAASRRVRRDDRGGETLGIFLIPMLYVIFQRMRERVGGTGRKEERLTASDSGQSHQSAE